MSPQIFERTETSTFDDKLAFASSLARAMGIDLLNYADHGAPLDDGGGAGGGILKQAFQADAGLGGRRNRRGGSGNDIAFQAMLARYCVRDAYISPAPAVHGVVARWA